MRMGVYSVHDKAADAFLPPFFLPTDSMAIREFLYCAQHIEDHKFAKHPFDYSLYLVGYFDDANGLLTGVREPLFLVAADGTVGSTVSAKEE